MGENLHGMLKDHHDMFGKYPRDASTPALPGIILRKNLDKCCSMVGKLVFRRKLD